MLGTITCILGLGLILLADEILWRHKFLYGELKRKFVHIGATCFIAFWPWLISWKTIQAIGIGMFIGLVINRYFKTLHYLGNLRKKSLGEFFLALAVLACASITDEKIFFAIAMLHVALADGLAAVIGSRFRASFRYTVFGQTKTVIGSMVFWSVSLIVLGVGALSAHAIIPYENYAVLLFALPPILTVLENMSVLGSDNLVIPVAVILALQMAQSAA